MQNLSNAAFHAGWVMDVRDTTLHIRLTNQRTLTVGEFFHVEASGPNDKYSFMANCILCEGETYVLGLASHIEKGVLSEESRVLITGVSGDLINDDLTDSIQIEDGSLSGMGGTTHRMMPMGSGTEVRIETPAGTVQALCQVRHCRPITDRPGLYRIGFLVINMDRVSKARWQKLLADQ